MFFCDDFHLIKGKFWLTLTQFHFSIERSRFHDDNENDNENDKEISLSFWLRFCTQRDERLIASISSSTTTITNRNPRKTQVNDDVSTHQFRSRTRCRCRSEILTSLLYSQIGGYRRGPFYSVLTPSIDVNSPLVILLPTRSDMAICINVLFRGP